MSPMDITVSQTQGLASKTARCPACLDSIAPDDEILQCWEGHAAIHKACEQLLSVCPAIGCHEDLSCEGRHGSERSRAITITSRDLIRSRIVASTSQRNQAFEYLRIQETRREIDSWDRWTFWTGLIFGILSFLMPLFLLVLVPALLAINELRKKERKKLNDFIRRFGGVPALQRYEGGRARAERRGAEMRRRYGQRF